MNLFCIVFGPMIYGPFSERWQAESAAAVLRDGPGDHGTTTATVCPMFAYHHHPEPTKTSRWD